MTPHVSSLCKSCLCQSFMLQYRSLDLTSVLLACVCVCARARATFRKRLQATHVYIYTEQNRHTLIQVVFNIITYTITKLQQIRNMPLTLQI